MKKYISIILSCAAVFFAASCQKVPVCMQGQGYLSLGELRLSVDEEVETKAVAAGGNYIISVKNASGDEVLHKTYSEVISAGDKISLPAGEYTLEARSAENVPVAAFEQPVYGTSKAFAIEAGQTTTVGELVCTRLQCKVTVAYSDEFLATVTGAGSTKVSVTSGYPLEYALNADASYDQSAGYFAVSGSTMEVVFSGNIEGKSVKQTKVFSGIAAKQWRQVRFVLKKNEQGNATFDIEIQDLISDAPINNDLSAAEDVIGDDPDAPKGDGGITLVPDYEAGCDAEIADLTNILIVPVETRDMSIKFKATVPGGVKKFTVNITSTNNAFVNAIAAADATNLDLINPTEDNAIIFTVVPFPHGSELLGQTSIDFELSAAQDAIIAYPGVHTFTMKITDQNGCSKEIPVVMTVE